MSSHNKFEVGTAQVDLVLERDYKLKITDGLLTGMHMMNESHINLLQSFLPFHSL
jgi:S-adenosylmethionine:tRNA-ribosyltransferase-isomerase (queuine synthetase)